MSTQSKHRVNKTLKAFAVLSLLTSAASLAIAGTNPVAVRGQSMTEGEILAFMSAIDQNEINAGKAATRKKIKPEVHDYAVKMQKEHGAHLRETQNLARKLKISYDHSKSVATEMQDGQKELSELSLLKGDEFAKSYLKSMVRDHSEALQVIDNQMFENVKNEELRAHLNMTREHIANHLEEAKKILAGL